MLAIAISTLVLSAGQGATLWADTWQTAQDKITVTDGGAYRLWAWAPAEKSTWAEIEGKRIELDKRKAEKNKRYVWLRGPEVALEPGPLAIKLGAGIATIALSTQSEFHPKKVLGDRRVQAEPVAVEDRRARVAKHTDTVFTMPHFDSKEAWGEFAERLRRRILLSSALYPMPERTPLNANVFDRINRDDYSVEKVSLEARPGFLVTGNLYRPTGTGPFPGVVCPHGHWANGRLEDGERGSVPARCITLARMGIVTFSYDMIGYTDSLQFKHNWGGLREKLWGLHPFAMQLWSSIRAVDFVAGLPDVDPQNIACTGASGGGTQTFALTAIDPRIKVAAPVNMISSTMQGGCLCENAPLIRLDNSNMEIGALAAPRPLLMVSATGDWTRETPRVEFPAIRSIYALYGAEDGIENVHVDAGHNYNQASREAMYRFFGKWVLHRDDMADFTEPAYQLEAEAQLRLFPDKQAPQDYPTKEQVIERVIASNRDKWNAVLPKTTQEVPAFRKQFGTVLADVLGTTIPEANDLAPERRSMEEREGYVVERWIIGRPCVGDAIPALLYRATTPTPQDAVLLVHGEGKAALANREAGGPGPLTTGLMAQGKAVLSIDAFLTGEHNAPDQRTKRRRQGNYMDTFQPTDTGYRVQDVLTAIAFLRSRRDMTGQVDLAGLGAAGIWCLFASAIDGQVPKTIADLNGFTADNDEAWVDTYYIPCIRSVGDIQTAVALTASRSLVLINAANSPIANPLGARVEAGPLDTATLLAVLE